MLVVTATPAFGDGVNVEFVNGLPVTLGRESEIRIGYASGTSCRTEFHIAGPAKLNNSIRVVVIADDCNNAEVGRGMFLVALVSPSYLTTEETAPPCSGCTARPWRRRR